MKNKKNHKSLETLLLAVLILILSSVCACLFFSCGGLFQSPPFILSAPECVLTSETGNFRFAGVKFSVWNARQAEIKGITAVYSVYKDAQGGNPLCGKNIVTTDFDCTIAAGGCMQFESALDAYISEIPETPYYIDFLYLKEVVYADGQKWSDNTGTFFVRGKK